ncbi:LysR family transcriptional regulator [Hylemonella gracilis str. Niagara R]|uniref:LysR family transcriptional regulator n=1 Tax=Hylemonella gracilis str. Niagara R TaxID=1458275 RepID=A0A016XDW1_9BURK|nr:LysR family transcriptional regulator [Hylemonella gracilis]EYC50299.1 LysR family transcriptional regulator [Hylemonella gracilis str. Niagara R]
MIDNLQDLRIFDRTVVTGSMSAAARELGLSLAVVSKRLGALEGRLGLRLLQRTTRSQSLTPEGRDFHLRCVRILAEVGETEAFVAGRRETVSGQLSITAPRIFGRQYVVPLVSTFQAQHPTLSVRLLLRDEIVDLVDQQIDLAFRFGALMDSSLSARFIAPHYQVLCAAPTYIARHGAPSSLAALPEHACIVYGARPSAHWMFQVDGAPVAVKVRGSFMASDGEAALALALSGAGILYKSVWDVGAYLDAGQLVRVLPTINVPSEPLHAVFGHAQQLAPRVRQFLDFALPRLRASWRWELPAVSGAAEVNAGPASGHRLEKQAAM